MSAKVNQDDVHTDIRKLFLALKDNKLNAANIIHIHLRKEHGMNAVTSTILANPIVVKLLQFLMSFASKP